jgi:hypothetical protein
VSRNGKTEADRTAGSGAGNGTVDAESWNAVLHRLQESGTGSVQRLAQKAIRGAMRAEQDILTLAFLPSDKFVMQMLEKGANRQTLEQAVREIYGGRWAVRCVTISETPPAGDADTQSRNYLDEIAAEFSGGRLDPSGG